MRYQIQHMKQTFTLAAPQIWCGDYTYDTQKDWRSRIAHNPWCWFSTSDRDNFPHFTAYANDFSGNGQTATLLKFHITFNYRGQTHLPIHVHYNVGPNNQAAYNYTDANRAGHEKNGARGFVNQYYKDFDMLAESFLENAFAIQAGPLGHLAGQNAKVIAVASQQAIFDSITDDDL